MIAPILTEIKLKPGTQCHFGKLGHYKAEWLQKLIKPTVNFMVFWVHVRKNGMQPMIFFVSQISLAGCYYTQHSGTKQAYLEEVKNIISLKFHPFILMMDK